MDNTDNNDRREIDKLRAKLEEERFENLKSLINTRFDRSDEKFAEHAQSVIRLEKKIDEHISTPHNLAAVAAAAAAIPPLQPDHKRSFPGLRFLERLSAKLIGLVATLLATGSLAVHGCNVFYHPYSGEHDHRHQAEPTHTPIPANPPVKGPN